MNQCTDPKLEAKLGLAIVFAIGCGKEPELTAELAGHLDVCSSCRENLPALRKKGEVAFRANQAAMIADRALAGDPRVLTKKGATGTAYFQPHEEGTTGLLARVNGQGIILDAEETTLEEFLRLSL